jgi:hypothetical protein
MFPAASEDIAGGRRKRTVRLPTWRLAGLRTPDVAQKGQGGFEGFAPGRRWWLHVCCEVGIWSGGRKGGEAREEQANSMGLGTLEVDEKDIGTCIALVR